MPVFKFLVFVLPTLLEECASLTMARSEGHGQAHMSRTSGLWEEWGQRDFSISLPGQSLLPLPDVVLPSQC